MKEQNFKLQKSQRFKFSILLAVIEVIVCVFFGVFMKVEPHSDSSFNKNYYPMYQDVNVMMLIGFGFLMTFIKGYTWSTLSYTFFLNAVVVQLYLLFQPFWHTVFHSDGVKFNITINEKNFTAASYSVASMLISFGAVIGKVGPLELLVMVIIGTFGYTLNQDIIYNQLKLFDAGGSTAIHTFGAFFGLVVSYFISKTEEGKKVKPIKTSMTNNTFAMIGSLFLWMYWPSFNAGYFPTNSFQKSLIIGNTIISLTASCLSAFVFSQLTRQKFSMQDIVNATLAGGVIIGAPSGLITNIGGALAIGCIGGIISTLCFSKLAPKFQKFFHIHDSCGVHNLHGIPGFLGGILSAIVIAAYNSKPIAEDYKSYLPFSDTVNLYSRTFTQQAGVQVAGTFVSLGIGIFCGITAGIIISFFYSSKAEQYFSDQTHFQLPQIVGPRGRTSGVTQQVLIESKG